jgi:signal transduction histidine kinase
VVDPVTRLARVPRRPPRSDIAAAAALAVWAVTDAIVNAGPGTTAERVLFALVVTVPLVVRRRAPLAVALILSAATVAWALSAAVPEAGVNPLPSLLLAVFSVALYAATPAGAVAGGLALTGSMAIAIASNYTQGHLSASNIAILAFFMGGAWTAGWLIRRRAAQLERAYAESGTLAQEAVAQERARIARELHDIVAHSVSIIAVQAGAAEELLDSDPELARAHMGAVRRTARETMSEMRRLLNVLREDDAPHAPQPGLARLDELLDDVRAAGVPVELVEEGERPALGPGVDLVAYRVVQESLTNVRKHAGAVPTQVLLRYTRDQLAVDVSNSPGERPAAPNGAGGHGLIGMRERVVLFGGTFDATPRDDGGFHVHADLPIESGPA